MDPASLPAAAPRRQARLVLPHHLEMVASNRNVYYLYREGRWLRARYYSGPWTVISIAQAPRPVLSVPVEQYRERPPHWAHHGPPPWAHERERQENRGHGHDRGRD